MNARRTPERFQDVPLLSEGGNSRCSRTRANQQRIVRRCEDGNNRSRLIDAAANLKELAVQEILVGTTSSAMLIATRLARQHPLSGCAKLSEGTNH